MENNRNYFVAIALSVLILIAWQFLYINPKIEAERMAAGSSEGAADHRADANAGRQAVSPPRRAAPRRAGAVPGSERPPATRRSPSRPRVAIDTPALERLDQPDRRPLRRPEAQGIPRDRRQESPIITLFSPADTKDGYFTELGYIGDEADRHGSRPSTDGLDRSRAATS